jgi:hypothetical protein
MLDDPRTKARSFLESSCIVSEIEDVLNHLIYEKPDDLHGYLVSRKNLCMKSIHCFFFDILQANHFIDQSKQPQIANLTLRRLMGPAAEPSVHIDLTIAVRNRTEVKINDCLIMKFVCFLYSDIMDLQ